MNGRVALCIFILLTSVFPSVLRSHNCGEAFFQVGWFAASQGESQHVNIENLIGDDFSVTKSTNQNFLVGLGYYFKGLNIAHAKILYGINAFYLAPTQVRGDVTQEDLFTNLSYQYSITHYPIYIGAKALVNCCSHSDLTFDLGIGPNILSAGNFSERSLDGITIPDVGIFARNSSVQFSAMAGLGWRIDKILGNLALEINYRFFYLGEGGLKRNNDQILNSLNTGQCYANALFLSISL